MSRLRKKLQVKGNYEQYPTSTTVQTFPNESLEEDIQLEATSVFVPIHKEDKQFEQEKEISQMREKKKQLISTINIMKA